MPEKPPPPAGGRTAEGLYPIRTVSALTGVNPVTLRAWERRYGLIRPQRTPKGHRLYAEADIDRIRRILALLEQGIPIGQTRRLLDAEPDQPAPEPVGDEGPWESYREHMERAVARFDDKALEAAYNEALSLYPVALVSRSLIAPLVASLRQRWRGQDDVGCAEAQFFNAYMRNKLGARFHHAAAQSQGPRVVAAGLPGSTGEIELLLFALEALAFGYRVVLLGANAPLTPLAEVARRTGARAIVLYGDDADALESPGDALARLVAASDCPVLVGGALNDELTARILASGAQALDRDPGEAIRGIRERLV